MADGAIDVHVDGLRELGTGLTTLADALGGTLGAVDALPLDAVAPVLGPVGADFMAALLSATARHREVLAGVARVSDAAGQLVLETGRVYAESDDAGADAIGAAGNGIGGTGGVGTGGAGTPGPAR
ncbi:type VII secretion target [Dietzia psychralcaliphila]|uniref:type VII secretion target n=1 Tax=Dietzia psychralcaliphila TaxID=139021 RepID=UPI001C1DF311|nr:type VII secretion target [Dietzia psychralcaliphila]